jgi:protein tyrosine kinase modulator
MKQAALKDTLDQLWVFWNAIRQYRGWIFLSTVFLSMIGFTYIFMMPDHYRATTTILVDPQKVPEKYVSTTVNSDPAERLNTISDQVLSSTRLQQIIEELHLYPELRGKLSRQEIVDIMRKYLDIKVRQGSSTGLSSFTIEYEGTNAQQVAQVANQLASSFISWNEKSREQQAEDTSEFLTSQLTEAKGSLEQQEKQLSAFKMRHLGEMPEQQTANLQALSQLQMQFQANVDALNRLEVERTMLTRGLEPAAPGAGPRSTTGPTTERAQLETERQLLKDQLLELQRRYTEAYPEARDAATRLQRVEEQLKNLPFDPPVVGGVQDNSAQSLRLQLLDRETARLNEQQAHINAQISAYRDKVDAVPVREQEIADLERNYGVSKEHYQSLLDKTFSAEMSADLERRQQAEHFTIVDLAQVPERPFKPKRALMLVGAFIGALGLSLTLAYLKDSLNDTIKIEQELKASLPANIALLTCVPKLPVAEDRRMALRFAVVSGLVAISGCCLEIALYLKLHPIL